MMEGGIVTNARIATGRQNAASAFFPTTAGATAFFPTAAGAAPTPTDATVASSTSGAGLAGEWFSIRGRHESVETSRCPLAQEL
jgi:hypothetical protein